MNIDGLKAAASKGQGFARSNAFQVTLPSLNSGYDSRELNVLCSNVNLPGRQIMTQERLIGIKGRKMPNGFASDDINMTFYVMNNFTIKEYFEEWQQRVVNQNTFEIGYPTDYAKDVTISQLKRGMALDLPIDKFFGFNIDIDIATRDSISYTCKLLDAFPTTMNSIELNNELDGLVQLQVQLSYRNWKKV
ncbi:hypothetical protein N9Z53_03940 [Mariniblastus sp.]|jgi:hypothetical protein|nr:hypothetical protein [Mariniblastus sp.]